MIIKEIKERIDSIYGDEELCDYSKFFLSEYSKNPDGEYNLYEVIALENNPDTFQLKEGFVITDKDGRQLIEGKGYEDLTVVHALSEDKILIAERCRSFGEHSNGFSYTLYTYDGKGLKPENTLKDNKKIFSVDVVKTDDSYPTLIITEYDGVQITSYLYSTRESERISPIFRSIELIPDSDNKLLKYTDTIYSNEAIEGKRESTCLTGFMNIDGTVCNNVFDDRTNSIRNVTLNTQPNHIQYNALRKTIVEELDDVVSKKIEKQRLKEAAIKRLEKQSRKKK